MCLPQDRRRRLSAPPIEPLTLPSAAAAAVAVAPAATTHPPKKVNLPCKRARLITL